MKRNESKPRLSAESAGSDRRREPRRPASERVSLLYYDPGAVVVSGVLVDRSDSGFRVSHDSAELGAGRQVRFCWGKTSGAARVVWTRRVEGHVESGFAIESV